MSVPHKGYKASYPGCVSKNGCSEGRGHAWDVGAGTELVPAGSRGGRVGTEGPGAAGSRGCVGAWSLWQWRQVLMHGLHGMAAAAGTTGMVQGWYGADHTNRGALDRWVRGRRALRCSRKSENETKRNETKSGGPASRG